MVGHLPLLTSLAGVSGRMGRLLLERVVAAPDLALAAATVTAGNPDLGRDAGVLLARPQVTEVALAADPAVLAQGQVIIDFSRPAATRAHLAVAAAAGVPILVGTTGLGPAERDAIAAAMERTAVLEAPNTSLGIVLLSALVETAAHGLGPGYDIEILEAHHRHKVDAPSGTALFLGHAAARGRGVPLDEARTPPYDGETGPRAPGTIGFSVMRGGDIVGEHTVMFAGIGERLEITHRASNRAVFAEGALVAARWLIGKPPGLYAMRDVLGV
ncbi:MAG: 4-hydroxy-tetrahydrodipicolinate reductase [Alphaproteobacteria bacterium]|nr:4-hydroxy-tetrahydrodipicolinate reductase [Alphaproteobacteria bacterium]